MIRAYYLIFLSVLSLFLLGCAPTIPLTDFSSSYGPSIPKTRQLDPTQYKESLTEGKISFLRDVQPILESRCVVCHGCYDAPCQLKLESPEGIDRGGHKKQIYAARLQSVPPTRLSIDAKNTTEWRTLGFHPVLNEREDSSEANLHNSVLANMLRLKQNYTWPITGKLPNAFDFSLNRNLQCPTSEEFAQFAEKHPGWGMPYGFPPLKEQESQTLLTWLEEGAHYPSPPSLSAKMQSAVTRWETFLNGTSIRERLVARYIYEHLFMGHLYFENDRSRQFFRLVRSSTPTGQPIDEIASVRPYDDPGGVAYYRLLPIRETIVHKNHLPYEIGERRMRRIQELFFAEKYSVDYWPGYDPESSANPFKTFAAIPPQSRYRFLLDDAYFFISGFMKGPVCRGQVALNVIRDRFWVVFFDPDTDPISRDALFLSNHADELRLPSEKKSEIGLWQTLSTYPRLQETYLKAKHEYLVRRKDNIRNSLAAIWTGDRKDSEAALTVFRHFDSASLSRGFIGDLPLTAWAIDYPLLERIHYLLVAGFNVFGNVNHQLATRLFMDGLRNEAENNFLSFLPASLRRSEYHLWYRGLSAEFKSALTNPYYGYGKESAIIFTTSNPKKELFSLIGDKLGTIARPDDTIKECESGLCERPGTTALQLRAEQQLRTLAQCRGKAVQYVPELSYLRIHESHHDTKETKESSVYSLIKNEQLENVSFMLGEKTRRLPEEDTLTVVSEFVGSYPNFFFDIAIDDLPEFVSKITTLDNEKDTEELVSRFGIRRTNPQFWNYSDFFNQRYRKNNPIASGWFDLNRYENR